MKISTHAINPQNPLWYLIMLSVIFWPVWHWYMKRITDESDEPWGILSLLTILVLLFRSKQRLKPSTTAIHLVSGLLIIYCLSFNFIPPLIKGLIAMSCLAISLSSILYARTIHFGVFGLLLLSLPIIASLQFYAGYPIRVLIALFSSSILGAFGFQVMPEGTLLKWMGETIAIDAPCAGIKMMWLGLYINFCMIVLRNLTLIKSWVSTSFCLFSVFICNVFRATLLFFTETNIVTAPDFAHQGIGILMFMLLIVFIAVFHQIDQRRVQCLTG